MVIAALALTDTGCPETLVGSLGLGFGLVDFVDVHGQIVVDELVCQGWRFDFVGFFVGWGHLPRIGRDNGAALPVHFHQ